MVTEEIETTEKLDTFSTSVQWGKYLKDSEGVTAYPTFDSELYGHPGTEGSPRNLTIHMPLVQGDPITLQAGKIPW